MQPMTLSIGTVSYAAAAAAFSFLFALLVTRWRGRLSGVLLAAASLGTITWSLALAYLSLRPESLSLFGAILEVVRNALWFAFLMVLLGYSMQGGRTFRLAIMAIGLACLAGVASALYSGGVSPARPEAIDILSRLMLAVIGIVLVEQLYRNVDPRRRWGVKFLCLGLGGLFVCDFYLYSDALLFRRINADIWAARGVANAVVVPLLAVAVARNPKWPVNITLSRQMVFYTSSVLGAAAYLFVMAAAGYYIRYFGGNWGVVLQMTFWFGALLLLFVALFSGTMRARLKVWLSKHFFRQYFDYREEWLRFTRTLSEGEPGIRMRERSIEAIAELVHSPAGALWLTQDTGTFEPVARWNMPATQGTIAGDSQLCRFLEMRQWVIDLRDQDAQLEPYDSLDIPDWLQQIPNAWLIVPLIHHEQLLGFVVLARSKGKIKLNWEVIDLLKTAGRQAASYLAQLEAAQALLVANQFESFNRMSAFVVHDLKNLVAQLSLLLSNAHKHKHKPEFQDDMIGTIANSVEKMERLLFQLRGNYSLGRPEPVELNGLLRGAVAARATLKPVPQLEVDQRSVLRVIAHDTRLERVLGHLIQNAIEATPAEGRVSVKLNGENGSAIIVISDNGCGMSEQFVTTRLFKPFESTKATGMGIGTYEARQYIREIGGKIEVASAEGVGTTFRVVLPVAVPDDKRQLAVREARA
jgi:putative PEP-CTERM system histidine kinase